MAMLHVALPWSHLPTIIFLDLGALQPTVSAFFQVSKRECKELSVSKFCTTNESLCFIKVGAHWSARRPMSTDLDKAQTLIGHTKFTAETAPLHSLLLVKLSYALLILCEGRRRKALCLHYMN